MKKCSKCGLEKGAGQFYTRPATSKCKECYTADVRANYAKNRAKYARYERQRFQTPERKKMLRGYQKNRRLLHPDKAKAWQAVSYAVRNGHLKRQPCEVCGTTEKVQAHHDDYSKPLDVRWLCFKHHREIAHGQVVTAA